MWRLMNKKASLWDRPRPTLDMSVWDEGKKLRPEHKRFIMESLKEEFLSIGFEQYDLWLEDLIVAGSIASYQYNEESDVDVDAVVNLQDVVDYEYGGGVSKAQAKLALESVKKIIKEKYLLLPGTKHQFEPFFIYKDDPSPKTALPKNVGLYSIIRDEWIAEPSEVDLSSSVEKLYPELMDFVWGLAEKYNLAIMGMRQDIVDAKYLRSAINQFPSKYHAIVEKEIEAKIAEINGEIESVLEDTEELYEQRYSGPYPVMPAEIQFTYLRRYGYLWLMGQMDELLQDGVVDEEELDDLGDLLREVPRH
jgi:hypothetical protein